MLSTLSVLLYLNAFGLVQSLIAPHSKPTSPADNVPNAIQGWTPKPTKGPSLYAQRGKGWGAVDKRELFGRTNDVATCGYYNEDESLVLTCDSGSACAFITSPSPQWFACCPTDKNGEVNWASCPYYNKCYPFDNYKYPNTWTGSYVRISITLTSL